MTSLKFHNGVWQSNLRPTPFISPPCLNTCSKSDLYLSLTLCEIKTQTLTCCSTLHGVTYYVLWHWIIDVLCFLPTTFLVSWEILRGFFVCFSFFPPHNWWSIMCALSKIIDTKRQAECLHEWARRWGETAWLTTHSVNQTYVSIYSQKVCGKVVSYMVYSGASTHQKTHKSTIWGEDNKIQMTLISLRRLRERETVSKQGHLPKSGLVLSAKK